MLFFATCALVLRMWISWSKGRREVRCSPPADKQLAGAGESGEAFLAAPLATSEIEAEDEEEEVALTFQRGHRDPGPSAAPVSHALEAV